MHIRTIQTEVRAVKQDDEKMTAAGRAVPYGVETTLWKDGNYEEREVIQVGAFSASIDSDDQRALWSHKREIVLGRVGAGTVRLVESKAGVDFEIDFPNSPEGQSKFISVERGDVNEVSFGFDDIDFKEEFFKEGDLRIWKRTVTKGKLWEISPVAWAAYGSETSVQARSKDISQRKQLIDSKLEEASPSFDSAAALQRDADLRDMYLGIMGGN